PPPTCALSTYTFTDLGTLGGPRSAAYGIGANGDVVGSAATADESEHAALWHDGRITDLGTLGGARGAAEGAGEAGNIVGESPTAAGNHHAFLWKHGAMTDLGTLDGDTS